MSFFFCCELKPSVYNVFTALKMYTKLQIIK